jgi:FkbM family methyltransferase
MFQTIRYHLLKTYYILLVALKLASRDEYDWKKTAFKPKQADYVVQARGSGFRRKFGLYLSKNKDILHDKYLSLISGLDDESANTIQVMISRLMKYCQNGIRGWKKMQFDATDVEAQTLKKMNDDFHSKVIKFPNGIYAYKSWLLPNMPLPEVFFEKHYIDKLDDLNKLRNKDIIDVGAYIGDSALVLQDYTDKNVYSFDPHPRHIEKIFETIKLNNCTKIIPVPLGLGDKTEGSFMRENISMGRGFSRKGVSVNITTLDEWGKNNNVEIGLIKVDVEGFEQKFLAGAIETIRNCRPAMLISLYHNADDLFEIKPFIDGLNLGYKFKICCGSHVNILNETVLVCEA